MENHVPLHAIFPGLFSIRIKSWYWCPLPSNFVIIYFRNGSSYQFYERDGFSWQLKEREGIIEINGWNFDVVQDVARKAGGSVPTENIFFYSTPQTPKTVLSGPALQIPDIPLDDFSLDIIVKAEDLADEWVENDGNMVVAGNADVNAERTEMNYFDDDDDDAEYETLATVLSDGDGHNDDRLIKGYDIVGLMRARRKLEF